MLFLKFSPSFTARARFGGGANDLIRTSIDEFGSHLPTSPTASESRSPKRHRFPARSLRRPG